MSKKKKLATLLFAAFMVLCGLVSILFTLLTFFEYRPFIYYSSTPVNVREWPKLGKDLQVKADEWPLFVDRQFANMPEQLKYEVRVNPGRGGGFLSINVTSVSPESSEAFSKWLGKTFAAGLNESYAARGLAAKSAGNDRTESELLQPDPIWLDAVALTLRTLLPTLLIIGGIALFRVRL